jgi:hypothetical protein
MDAKYKKASLSITNTRRFILVIFTYSGFKDPEIGYDFDCLV